MESNSKDKLEIELSESSAQTDRQKLVIELDELPAEDYIEPYPGGSKADNTIQKRLTSLTNDTFLFGSIWPLMIAGFLGGFLAWVITEQFYDDYAGSHEFYYQLLLEIAVFTAVVGGAIGAFLGSVEGFISKVLEKTLNGFAVALGFGLIGGAVGGVIAQIVYTVLGGGALENTVLQIIVRAFTWGIVGLFVGVGQGLGTGGGKRVLNGLLGGLAGGLMGGFLFDIIGEFTDTGSLSRAIAIPLIGVCTGLGIGLVREIRKEAWLRVIEGATVGKEYIIYGHTTTIGSSFKCEIVLIKDPSVAPIHAEIVAEGNNYRIRVTDDQLTLNIGNRITKTHKLHNGNVVKIGNTVMMFFEKPAKG
jgi:hypothetical protein